MIIVAKLPKDNRGANDREPLKLLEEFLLSPVDDTAGDFARRGLGHDSIIDPDGLRRTNDPTILRQSRDRKSATENAFVASGVQPAQN